MSFLDDLFGGSDDTAARLAQQSAEEEAKRQRDIRYGVEMLDRMFAADPAAIGVNPFDSATMKFDPRATYYDAQGQPIVWAGDPLARRARDTPGLVNVYTGGSPLVQAALTAMEQSSPNADTGGAPGTSEFAQKMLTGGVFTGKGQGGGYNSLYDKAYQAQKAYENPQIQQQFQDAQRQLAYGLARQGIQGSSSAGRLQADLSKQQALATQGMEDRATQARTHLQQSVADEHDALVALLNQTGNTASTMNSARDRAAYLSQPQPLQDVGPYFQNATATLADMIVSPAVRLGGGGSGGGYGVSSQGSGKIIRS